VTADKTQHRNTAQFLARFTAQAQLAAAKTVIEELLDIGGNLVSVADEMLKTVTHAGEPCAAVDQQPLCTAHREIEAKRRALLEEAIKRYRSRVALGLD